MTFEVLFATVTDSREVDDHLVDLIVPASVTVDGHRLVMVETGASK